MNNVNVIYDSLECDNVETLVLWPILGMDPHDMDLNESVRKTLKWCDLRGLRISKNPATPFTYEMEQISPFVNGDF